MNPFDTKDVTGCARRKTCALESLVRQRKKRRHLSSHFQPVPRFPLSNFTPWVVNFQALPECTIQLLPVLMGPHPRPCGWLCHPTPEMAGRARNSKQGTGWPSSSDRQGQGPSSPRQTTRRLCGQWKQEAGGPDGSEAAYKMYVRHSHLLPSPNIFGTNLGFHLEA